MLLLSRTGDGVRALIGVCEMMYGVCRVVGGSSLPLDQPTERVELNLGMIAQSPGYHPNSPTHSPSHSQSGIQYCYPSTIISSSVSLI